VSAGWWRPVVLLPTGLLARMPVDLIEALLAHELAHIRRHDYLVNLLQNAIEAVLFYHPVTWWLSHRIRVEREQIADQLAAEVVCAPRRLALALSELSDLQRTPLAPALHLMQAAQGGQLMSRIQQLVNPVRRTHPAARIAFPLLGLLAACIATATWAQLGDRDDEGKPAITAHGTFFLEEDNRRNSFALVGSEGDEMHMWGSIDDIESIKAARKGIAGEYLWFRRSGKAYIVTDPAVLARIRGALRESDELGKKMEALGDQMEPYSERMEALGEKMEALSEDMEPTDAFVAAQRRMEDLGGKQSALGRKQSELARKRGDIDDGEAAEALEREMDAITRQMDAIGEQMDAQSRVMERESAHWESRQVPMEALSRQMEQESKPMEAIGKQMEVQGRLLDEATKKAEQQIHRLIDEAMAAKLARPAPKP
jgi:predicted  nucleic acid-binding Zn-ribbon protein